jgi:hypothetical protein
MAGSCTTLVNHRHRLRSRTAHRMDPEIWSTINHHQRPWTSIYFNSLVFSLQAVGYQTTAYHPQSNGIVERFHRRLKDALRARAAAKDWSAHLPLVMLGIRSAWRPDSEYSPAEAVYGTQPLLPGQFLTAEDPPPPSFLSDLQQLLANRTAPPTAHHNTPAPLQLPEDLLQARHVLVRKDGHVPPLAAAYDGPFLVLERSLRTFKLQIGNKTENVSTLRLKACFSPPDVQVAQPPKRGRPPKTAAPPSDNPPASPPTPQPQRAQRRRVTFRCPPTLPSPSPTVPPQLYPSGRPARSAGPPKRYLLRLDLLRRPQLGGEL